MTHPGHTTRAALAQQVSGRNVWIHDCEVWNQDDTIAVKDDSKDMVFERVKASGVGLTIGSIGSSVVRNITFRDCAMPQTYKGIYLKFRDSAVGEGGTIADVTFEDILIDEPSQWPIWIGPAQQSDSDRLCAAHPCSICWPELATAECMAPAGSAYANVSAFNEATCLVFTICIPMYFLLSKAHL